VFDGWFPTSPCPAAFAAGLARVRKAADEAQRPPPTPAVYLTVALADDPGAASARLRQYMEEYYGVPFELMSKLQGTFAGTPAHCAEWLRGYVSASAEHLVLRSVDLPGQLESLAGVVRALRS
jgi:alkanesulfonate monooxygenase SsuD/methylene tetrahydromethanopterin reductase-like flavin-dependent oxidoreductase (luciferase family)